MSANSASPPTAAQPSGSARTGRRRVVDAPTRLFHWGFALSFGIAYLTGDSERWRALHVTFGYVLGGLLAFRILWGLVGPRRVRLGAMRRTLAGTSDWLRSAVSAARNGALSVIEMRRGENLAMALAVVTLLALALPLVLSGYGACADGGDFIDGDWLAEVHEFFGSAMLATVLTHVGLVATLSVTRRQNLAGPMFTGYARGIGPDLVRRNHRWLAALLLLALTIFIGWRWQHTPAGLVPSKAVSAVSHHRDHGHEDD